MTRKSVAWPFPARLLDYPTRPPGIKPARPARPASDKLPPLDKLPPALL